MGAGPAASGGPLKCLEAMKGWGKHLLERYYRIPNNFNSWIKFTGFSEVTKLRKKRKEWGRATIIYLTHRLSDYSGLTKYSRFRRPITGQVSNLARSEYYSPDYQ